MISTTDTPVTATNEVVVAVPVDKSKRELHSFDLCMRPCQPSVFIVTLCHKRFEVS
jgi:hypothetical protein